MTLKGKTVLLVADDIGHRDRLARRLHEQGCDVVTADNGALGVLAAHAEQPSLVIAESNMPVMNGYHLVEVLRSDVATHAIPVILLVPAVDDAAIARCWANGADFCLPKGSAFTELALTIDRTLEEPRPAEYQAQHTYAA
jgi:CheY-like chemotaxis protein